MGKYISKKLRQRNVVFESLVEAKKISTAELARLSGMKRTFILDLHYVGGGGFRKNLEKVAQVLGVEVGDMGVVVKTGSKGKTPVRVQKEPVSSPYFKRCPVCGCSVPSAKMLWRENRYCKEIEANVAKNLHDKYVEILKEQLARADHEVDKIRLRRAGQIVAQLDKALPSISRKLPTPVKVVAPVLSAETKCLITVKDVACYPEPDNKLKHMTEEASKDRLQIVGTLLESMSNNSMLKDMIYAARGVAALLDTELKYRELGGRIGVGMVVSKEDMFPKGTV